MSIFKKNLEKNAVKKALNEIQINLENNYKDLAIKAYNDASCLSGCVLVLEIYSIASSLVIPTDDIYAAQSFT